MKYVEIYTLLLFFDKIIIANGVCFRLKLKEIGIFTKTINTSHILDKKCPEISN